MVTWRFKKISLVLAVFIISVGVYSYLASVTEGYLEDLKSKNIMVKCDAIYQLGEDQEEDAIPMLIKLINDEQPKKIRLSAIEALGKMYQSGLVDELFGFLADEDTKTRSAVVDGLINLLTEEDMEIRLAAVEALGKIKEPRAVKPLINMLDDEDSRLFVIRALGNIGDDSAVPALTELLDNPDEYVSYNASRALKRIGEAE
jgi:HEAT repeat protein